MLVRLLLVCGVDRKIRPEDYWHHAAYRVMPDSDREGRIFLSTLTPMIDSFSLFFLFFVKKDFK